MLRCNPPSAACWEASVFPDSETAATASHRSPRSRTMKTIHSQCAAAVICLCLLAAAPAPTQSQSPSQKEATLSNHATGPFDVKVIPQDDKSGDAALGRMTIDKQYHGDLEGTGK